jgi:GntR family transcriptional regulator, rspAB operon transcriptional repressor
MLDRSSASTKVKPVSRSLLKDKAYHDLKHRIQNGSMAAGDFLSERQLSGLLKMSKTPIKAALERLAMEGFIAVSPQQGIVVRELSLQEVVDQFELRQALECYVVQSIAGKITVGQQKVIEANLKAQTAAAKANDVGKLVELDADFHLQLCHALGNTAILTCMTEHRSKMHRVIHQVMSQATNRLADAVKEHRSIYDAIKSGKAKLSVELVIKHLEFGKQLMLSTKLSGLRPTKSNSRTAM